MTLALARLGPWCKRRVSLCLLAAAALAGLPGQAARAAEATAEALQVTDSYLELRTGPGRGFPIFFVVKKSEWITIELRHTDWYRVFTAGGKQGWVTRKQLETTLTQAGGTTTFRDLLLDDYLRRRVEFGAAWGRFKTEPMLKVFAGYRLAESVNVEATVGQVQGVFSGTDFWHVNLQTEPWSDQRFSPFFGVGFGRFKNIPNLSLVSALPTNANLANATLGLRFYLSERIVLRTDYSIYTAFVADTRSTEYRAVTAGLSFFF